MLSFPNCKINIGLYVTNKREDGYHDLETIFYPVALKDVLEIVPAKDRSSISVSGKTIEGADDDDNIVWKAFDLMRRSFPDKVPAYDIYLHKNIPMGAGLGGGSADGTFALRMINDLCNLNLSNEQLAELALSLGSDCPFFVYNTPQFATGRGEKLQPVNINLADYSLQLICPQIHVATGKAFSMLKPQQAPFDLRKLAEIPVTEWKNAIGNDFEDPVFQQHPALANIKQQLYDQGALYASMSGSGSSIFGIFSRNQRALINSDIIFEQYYMETA